MGGMYILDEHGEPQPIEDVLTWGRWMQTAARVVKQDRFDHPFPPSDDQIGLYTQRPWAQNRNLEQAVTQLDLSILVSTVFLGLNHEFRDAAPPILWESMVFGGPLDGKQRRYTSRAAALEGHAELCELVRLEIAAARAEH